jgi:MoxR-like ATPase
MAHKAIGNCKAQIQGVLDIDDDTLDFLVLPIICGGHALLHGMIGTAKTSAVMALAQTLDLDFGIYQCHPETVPSDLGGFEKYNQKTHDFEIRRGPILESQVLLVDEINRMPPRSQAALLGPMAQGMVTIGATVLNVPEPFTVYATQNPIEMQGVYPLAEAQIDRFMLQIPIGYHSYDGMAKLLGYNNAADTQERIRKLPKVLTKEVLMEAREAVDNITLGGVKRWIKAAYLCCCPTKQVGRRAPAPDWTAPELTDRCVRMGVSPRGLIDLAQAARGMAYLMDGGPVKKEHVEKLAGPVFRHRIVLNRLLPEGYRGLTAAEQADRFIDEVLQSHWKKVHDSLFQDE